MRNAKDTRPQWSKHGAAITFTTKNTNKWVNILASRYYNNIDPSTNSIHWNDIMDKHEVDMFQSQIHITTSLGMDVSITIFFTTNTICIQGRSMEDWEKFEYPSLQQIYDIAANIPGDIDILCEQFFKEDPNFAIFKKPETDVEDTYTPWGIPSEVKDVLNDVIKKVCQQSSRDTRKKTIKTPKTPKKSAVTKKISLEEQFARNVTLTVNKLDDRLTNVTDELRAEVMSNVKNGLTHATEVLRSDVNAVNFMQELGDYRADTLSLLDNKINPLSLNYDRMQSTLNDFRRDRDIMQGRIDDLCGEVKLNNSLTVNLKKVVVDEVQRLLSPLKEENISLKKELAAVKEMIVEMKWKEATKTPSKPTPQTILGFATSVKSPARKLPTLPTKPIPAPRPRRLVPLHHAVTAPDKHSMVAASPAPICSTPTNTLNDNSSNTDQHHSSPVTNDQTDDALESDHTCSNKHPTATHVHNPWLHQASPSDSPTSYPGGTNYVNKDQWLLHPSSTRVGPTHAAMALNPQRREEESVPSQHVRGHLQHYQLRESQQQQQHQIPQHKLQLNNHNQLEHSQNLGPRPQLPQSQQIQMISQTHQPQRTQQSSQQQPRPPQPQYGDQRWMGQQHQQQEPRNPWGSQSHNSTPHYPVKQWTKPKVATYDNIGYKEMDGTRTSARESRKPASNTQPDILVLMDSNRRFINFESLFPDEKVQVQACGTVEHAFNVVEKMPVIPKTVLIHLGTNDLNVVTPEEFIHALDNLTQYLSQEGCNVFISELLPRTDDNRGLCEPVNRRIHDLVPESNRIPHPKITHTHLHDEVHLRRNVNPGDKFSGVQLLAADLYKGIYNRDPIESRIARIGGDSRKTLQKNRSPGRGGH